MVDKTLFLARKQFNYIDKDELTKQTNTKIKKMSNLGYSLSNCNLPKYTITHLHDA